VEIPFTDAALGTSLIVETLAGQQELTIPAGTQPSTELILRQLGFPELRSGSRGNHIITINVTIPRRLNRRQRKLLAEFKDTKRRKLFS
jgi:molecular chaperone DnaJ